MTRRVVTGHGADGEPTIVSDGAAPRSRVQVATPGMVNTLVWATPATPSPDPEDPTPAVRSFVPAPGATAALLVTFPPDAVFGDPAFDPAAAAAEQLEATPGLAELFEPEAPGMHTTPTIDYGVVVSGELVLDLGTTSTVIRAGDVVVQNGTRHAWRNRRSTPATAFFVLIGSVTKKSG